MPQPDKLAEFITSDDVLGKNVFDPHGDLLGVVDSLYIHPTKFEVTGISIDKGFLKSGLVMGKQYVQEVTEHAVFLNTRPVLQMKGMKVFDVSGDLLGKVQEVVLTENSNSISSLVIKGKKHLVVPADAIERVVDNVILRVSHQHISSLNEL